MIPPTTEARIVAVKFIEYKQVLPKQADPLNTAGYTLALYRVLEAVCFHLRKSSTALMNVPNLTT